MNPLSKVFQLLNESASYAVLRNYESLPQKSGRDVDLIINRKDFKEIRARIVEIFATNRYYLFQYYKGSEMHSMVFVKADSYEFISFDFLFSIYIKNTILLTSEDVLRTKEFNGNIYHVRKDIEFLSKYMYNLLLKTPYPYKYKHIKDEAEAMFSNEINNIYLRVGFNPSSPSLFKVKFKGYQRHFFRSLGALIRYSVYTINNFFNHQGITIGFSGPDGVGKTTVIEQIQTICHTLYKEIPLFHFRPTFIGNLSEVVYSAGLKKEVDRDYSKPHRGSKTGVPSSFVRLAYYSVDYIIGYLLKTKHYLFKRNIVIFDRYYTDIICDSRRSRIYLDYKFIYWFGRLFIPSLNYNILLTASSEIILARKRELDEEGIRSINTKIDYLADKKEYKKILNESTPEVAGAEVLNYIFENQHKKNIRRLK